jgi:hypothetical protein
MVRQPPLRAGSGEGLEVPTAYVAGYEAARQHDPELAEGYVRNTMVGDPLADAVIRDLSALDPGELHQTLAQALDNPHAPQTGAPDSLVEFLEYSTTVPDWFDAGVARIASRAFLRNSDIVLASLVGGSIVEGFSTLISKSFRIRGRVTNSGVRRLKQNGMQLVEQYLPGGMEPGGDGWRLTLRVRLVHAQSRYLINQSDEWDHERLGEPISAAHMLLAGAAFSGRLMQHVGTLGGDFSDEEREAYIHVWRYTGLLIGIPEEILFHDFASACRAFEIGSMCEPPADLDAIIMANSIVNSSPLVIGITEPKERRKLATFVYRVCRELIGDDLADGFMFPKGRRKVIPFFRAQNRTKRLVRKVIPSWRAKTDLARFKALVDFVNLGKLEHSYSLPTAVHDEDSAEW